MFSSSRRNRVTRTDIQGLRDSIENIQGDINVTNDRIDDRVRKRDHLRIMRSVRQDIRSLVDKIDKNKDFIFLAADCNNPGPDVNPVCSRIRPTEEEDDGEEEQSGGRRKRKSRKKRGKGLVSSKMRRKKHMSARQPKNEYLEQARQILNTYLNNPNVPESSKGRKLRNLALELEDDAKKGGRRKRKSRRKTKKKRRKTRNKKGGHHEAIVLGALALSKIFKKKKKKKKKTRKKRRR